MLENTLTHNLYSTESEVLVCSTILYSRDQRSMVVDSLKPDDFFHPHTKAMMQSVCDMLELHLPITATEVDTFMKSKNRKLSKEIAFDDGFNRSEDVLTAINIVKQCAWVRQSRELILKAFDKINIYNAGSTLEQLSKSLSDTIRNGSESHTTEKELTNNYLDNLTAGILPVIIPSGLDPIDNCIDGFSPGDIVTIAGRPGMGKTIIGLQIALNTRQLRKTAFLSLEMPNQQIVTRIIANQTAINYNAVRLNKADAAIISQYNSRIVDSLVFSTRPNIKIEQALPTLKYFVQQLGCEIVIIDHLEKLYSPSKGMSKAERIGEIMDKLKTAAVELSIPIVILQQLNRDSTDRKDSRPQLTDLKSSGAIEEWSDVVVLLHRESYYKDTLDDTIELIIAKSRSSKTGSGKCLFQPNTMQVVNIQAHGANREF